MTDTSTIDTSTAAVERLIALTLAPVPDDEEIAATLRALAAERDELRKALMAFADHFGPLEDNHLLNEDARKCFSLARVALANEYDH